MSHVKPLSKLSPRKLKSLISVELMKRKLSKSEFYVVHNPTNMSKITQDDRRITKNPVKFILNKELNINTDGLKHPAYYTPSENFIKFNENLKRIGPTYLMKIGKVYTSMPSVNTELLHFNTLAPKLLSIFHSKKYQFVTLLTVKPKKSDSESETSNTTDDQQAPTVMPAV